MSNPSSSRASYTYTISASAYAVPLFHAAAHPSSSCSGVFLGTVSPPSTTSSSTPGPRIDVTVTEAVPLVHRYTSLSPFTELGIEYANAYAEEKGWEIVGYYSANDDGSTALGRVAERVVERIRAQCPAAFALVVDNDKLSTSDAAYTVHGVNALSVSFPEERVRERTLRLIRVDGVHSAVHDFDDHLEDARIDWPANKRVIELIGNQLK